MPFRIGCTADSTGGRQPRFTRGLRPPCLMGEWARACWRCIGCRIGVTVPGTNSSRFLDRMNRLLNQRRIAVVDWRHWSRGIEAGWLGSSLALSFRASSCDSISRSICRKRRIRGSPHIPGLFRSWGMRLHLLVANQISLPQRNSRHRPAMPTWLDETLARNAPGDRRTSR